MLSIKIDSVISELVNQLLIEPGGRNNKALHFHLSLRMMYSASSAHHYRTNNYMHLLYFLPRNNRSVTVFSALNDQFTKIHDVKSWKHEISHDSSWRNIQIFSNTYFNMASKINNILHQNGFNAVAPASMTDLNRFNIFGPVFDWVKCKVTFDPECENNYRRIITLL